MEADTKSKILFLGVFLCLISSLIYIGSSKHEKSRISDEQQVQDLGLTLAEFRSIYERKVIENELPLPSLPLHSIENGIGGFLYHLPYVDMEIYENKNTGNINKIVVIAEPFKETTTAEKTLILLYQYTVFSLATATVNPNMDNQPYRELVLKRLYSNIGTNYILNGIMNCRATKRGNVISLIAEAKNL